MTLIDAFYSVFSVIAKESEERKRIKYSLVSDSLIDGEYYAILRPKGIGRPFRKKIVILHAKEWLDKMNSEDAARVAFLYYLQSSGDADKYHLFSKRKSSMTNNYLILSFFFIGFLMLSNMTAFKLIGFKIFGFSFQFPVAIFFFALTYLFDDLITEVYGFGKSRVAIFGGLFVSILVNIGLYISILMPPSPTWPYQSEYSLVYSFAPRILFASLIGYFLGETINAFVLSYLKVKTDGKYFAGRLVASTSVGAIVDSLLFCFIAFHGYCTTSQVLGMVLVQYCFKLGYCILAIPLSYLIAGYLKNKDKVDYYDYETNYNPFSFGKKER